MLNKRKEEEEVIKIRLMIMNPILKKKKRNMTELKNQV